MRAHTKTYSNRTKKKIESGIIKVTAQKNPAFLYDGNMPGENFDSEDIGSGLFRGWFLERVSKPCFFSC